MGFVELFESKGISKGGLGGDERTAEIVKARRLVERVIKDQGGVIRRCVYAEIEDSPYKWLSGNVLFGAPVEGFPDRRMYGRPKLAEAFKELVHGCPVKVFPDPAKSSFFHYRKGTAGERKAKEYLEQITESDSRVGRGVHVHLAPDIAEVFTTTSTLGNGATRRGYMSN